MNSFFNWSLSYKIEMHRRLSRPRPIQTTFEKGFTFYSEPGRLQELACIVVSAFIWYRRIKECPRKVEKNGVVGIHWSQDFAADELHMSYMAELPSSLKKMIDPYFRVVMYSFAKWCDFHHLRIFARRQDAGLDYDLVDFVSWRADATINYTETAVNLINSDVLNDVERYRIACIYCLVDDVKKLWPMETDADRPLIAYWNYRMSGEQCTIQVDPESSCVEASLLKNCNAETWPAFEYLWEFLIEDEQNLKITEMARRRSDYRFLKYALLKLNERQLVLLMSKVCPVLSCFEFDKYATSVAEVLMFYLWSRVKNMITNESFSILIVGASSFREYHDLAFEIWNSASDTLKNHILVNHFNDILEWVCFPTTRFIDGLPKDARLLIELLSSRNADFRESFWREKWKRIIRDMSPEYVPQIMKLCLGSDDEVAAFKKIHFSNYYNFRYCCESMASCGNFEYVSKFFRFCSDDPEVIFGFRMNVLKLRRLLEYSFFRSKIRGIDSFETFLSETFTDTSQVNEFKRNLILGEESAARFARAIRRGRICNISYVVDRVLSSASDLVLAKSRLLDWCRDILISGRLRCFVGTHWDELIKWCLHGDDDAVQNFKLLLPVNQIYKALFDESIRRMKQFEQYSYQSFLHTLECFLKWVFMTEKAVKNFKLGKLHANKRLESIKEVLESNNGAWIDSVLAWFFNGDKTQIEKFKSSMFDHSNNVRYDEYSRCKIPFLC